MLDKNILHLLALVRIAVSGSDENSLRGKMGWNDIMEASKGQGVSAVVLDAMERLPSDMRPLKPLLLQWIGQTSVMERMYAKHQERIRELADFYKRHDIRLLLLKGYGCSLGYPVPEHRPTGDIDIYLFGGQQKADRLMEREHGIAVHREYHKHSTFSYHGVEVENHSKFIDDASHKSNIRFERILMSALEREECLKSPIDNVLLPPPTFNALFLLRHTGEHFASNGITLRHILDVGLFFRQHHPDIDWSFVFDVYKSERMLDFFNGIATICVEYLGIDGSCFAADDEKFSYKHDIELADRILADIFMPKDQLPMSMDGIKTAGQKLRYAVGKSRRWWRNRWKYRMVYSESLAESFLWLAKNRSSCGLLVNATRRRLR